ncbi:hypothetical protein [Vacuolonema iberomarrocanum]|uniref:hypothetical protein n=1 Tax=Vacuolonema iberomarrocanum TaxID=3454632 RepID=UPI0019E95AF8|nr:hypothetical protein [filamentous cyanobacterium LEGE 07170]
MVSQEFTLQYELHGAGWATASVEQVHTVAMTVSYLHDSLRQLAESAIALERHAKQSKVIFMSEPGEHQLCLTRGGVNELDYQIRWYDDWESWGMHPTDQYQVVLSGKVSVMRYREQVAKVLHNIYDGIGTDRYKELWVEHDFPTNEYRTLNTP